VGIAFAIPAETVKSVVAQLKDKGVVTRGWIGVQIQPVTSDIADSLGLKKAEGALVAEPQANSPAEKAGIKSGDVILSVNDEPVKDARALARRIGALAPGTTIRLAINRSGSERNLNLTLGELPNKKEARSEKSDTEDRELASTDVPKLGLSLSRGPKGAGHEGVLVTNVDPDGPAADHGFRTGDVILEVAGQTVSSPADVRKAVNEARSSGKRTVLMRVKSSEGTRFVAIPLGNA
jgi:serine protease Do